MSETRRNTILAAVDVQYDDEADVGRAAAVTFGAWEDPAPERELVHLQRGLQAYVPGQLYRRELPCLLPLVETIRELGELVWIVVDAYVDLEPGRPGLGRHLFEALGGGVQVLGVAKSHFHQTTATPVHRGRSRRPLWVSATTEVAEAPDRLCAMHGPHRIPTLLARADALARGAAPSVR